MVLDWDDEERGFNAATPVRRKFGVEITNHSPVATNLLTGLTANGSGKKPYYDVDEHVLRRASVANVSPGVSEFGMLGKRGMRAISCMSSNLHRSMACYDNYHETCSDESNVRRMLSLECINVDNDKFIRDLIMDPPEEDDDMIAADEIQDDLSLEAAAAVTPRASTVANDVQSPELPKVAGKVGFSCI